MNDTEFPPFVPAKPKGGVAAEIAATKSDWEKTVDNAKPPIGEPKQRRKRRTKAEMATGQTHGENAFVVYCGIVDALQYVDKKTRMMILQMLMDHHT